MSTWPSGDGSATPVVKRSTLPPESASTILLSTTRKVRPSMVDEKDDSKYPVGYKKPPRQTQFKPGQSGNAKGRPKGSKNCKTVFEKELRTPIPVTENGKRKKISKLEAIIKHTVNKAAGGDPKATVVVLNET